jgi:hypothetical protein
VACLACPPPSPPRVWTLISVYSTAALIYSFTADGTSYCATHAFVHHTHTELTGHWELHFFSHHCTGIAFPLYTFVLFFAFALAVQSSCKFTLLRRRPKVFSKSCLPFYDPSTKRTGWVSCLNYLNLPVSACPRSEDPVSNTFHPKISRRTSPSPKAKFERAS